MGGSAWHYVVDHQDDVKAAFATLQQKVLAEGDYYPGFDNEFAFASFAELDEAREDEDFWEAGTHSILDMVRVVQAEEEQDVAVVRVLRADEVRARFGSDQPTAADFERLVSDGWPMTGWEGHVTALYENGKPTGLAFWGASGD
ncbi:hypothetical protein [Actinophytocola sp. NPDC049390]|uniref:hypothetical protein n=1 Tax=Actinophytocola sp. NPDC049390 TaxID=3363894 RepID=UPI0037BA1119